MWLQTRLVCPLCGNEWFFVHTYHEEPILGYCEKCITHFNSGVEPRNMIEHRRPKTLYDPRPSKEIWDES